MQENNPDNYVCEGCGRELPRYVDGQFAVSQGCNMGWGVMEWCHDCCPVPESAEDIIKSIDLHINPPKEMPEITEE